MSPREESNLDQELRSLLFYPLNYGGKTFVGLPGFEPGLKRPKRLVLPLHYSPNLTILAHAKPVDNSGFCTMIPARSHPREKENCMRLSRRCAIALFLVSISLLATAKAQVEFENFVTRETLLRVVRELPLEFTDPQSVCFAARNAVIPKKEKGSRVDPYIIRDLYLEAARNYLADPGRLCGISTFVTAMRSSRKPSGATYISSSSRRSREHFLTSMEPFPRKMR